MLALCWSGLRSENYVYSSAYVLHAQPKRQARSDKGDGEERQGLYRGATALPTIARHSQ